MAGAPPYHFGGKEVFLLGRGNAMNNESDKKVFLTYNQQMKKLRDVKKIVCTGTPHKTLLVRSGYFNLVNGYKMPFVNGRDASGNHTYLSETSIQQLFDLKTFDEELRSLLLKYITKVEEEVRALAAYKFDEVNNNGRISWYETNAYSNRTSLQSRMSTISKAYQEISRSRLDYVRFYMEHHSHVPTWIMIKAVNFSTFIDVLNASKLPVKHAICKLYGMFEDEGTHPNVKLLIGSLHWMRRIRNSCAHNERIYCLTRESDSHRSRGRIIEKYIKLLRPSYQRKNGQRIFDLFVYMKYYLPSDEYMKFIERIKSLLFDLKSKIHPQAFDHIRAQMGITDIEDLDALVALPKDAIKYNKFNKL